MGRTLMVLMLCIVAASASAHPHRAAPPKHEPNFFERLFGIHTQPLPAPPRRHRVVARKPEPVVEQHASVRDAARPRDCYGIPWCGCWLRHHFGINDVRLNLARAWAKVGTAAEPAIGVIVVWWHHVGVITGFDGHNWIVTSGNDGHGNVAGTRPRSLHGAIAFRKL